MTLPWYDETDLPDEDAEYEDPYDDPEYNEDADPWVWRPVETVELPPMPGEGAVLPDGPGGAA